MMQRTDPVRSGWGRLGEVGVAVGLLLVALLTIELMLPALAAEAAEVEAVMRLGLGCLGRPEWAC